MPVTALPIIEGRWAFYQTADSPEAGEVNDADPSALTGISSHTDGDARAGLQWPSCAPWPVPPTSARIPISTTGDGDWSHFPSDLHPNNCDLGDSPNIDWELLVLMVIPRTWRRCHQPAAPHTNDASTLFTSFSVLRLESRMGVQRTGGLGGGGTCIWFYGGRGLDDAQTSLWDASSCRVCAGVRGGRESLSHPGCSFVISLSISAVSITCDNCTVPYTRPGTSRGI
jgi:hypothetical protein